MSTTEAVDLELWLVSKVPGVPCFTPGVREVQMFVYQLHIAARENPDLCGEPAGIDMGHNVRPLAPACGNN